MKIVWKILRVGFVLFFAAFFIALFDKNNMEHTSMFTMIVETLHNKIDRTQYEVIDDSFLKPHFTSLPLTRAKELLDSNKTKLLISMVIKQKLMNNKSHKIKLLVATNTYNPYFKEKKFFKIASKSIALDTCKKYKKNLLQSSNITINLYIKNNLYAKKMILNKEVCNKFDTSLLKGIKKRYEIKFSSFIPTACYPYVHITKEVTLTNDYLSKNIFQGIDTVYKKSHFTVLKDLDNRAFVFQDKKLLKVINLDIRDKAYKANFLINANILYYTDAKLHLLNLTTLKEKIAPSYAPYFYTIFMQNNNLHATFKKDNTNYLLVYDKNLQVNKLYTCNRKLKDSFFDKNFFIPYDGKFYEFDKDFKLVKTLKRISRSKKTDTYNLKALSLQYAPSKKLLVYKDYFAYKTVRKDGVYISLYKDFKLIKQIKIPYMHNTLKSKSDFYIDNGVIAYFNFDRHIIFQNLQSQKERKIETSCKSIRDLELHDDLLYTQCKHNIVLRDLKTDKEVILPSKNFRFKNLQNIRKYMNDKEKVYIFLSMSNMDENRAFYGKDTMRLQGKKLTLKTETDSKIFLINKKEGSTPRFAITQNYFIYTEENAVYAINKSSFKAIKLTISHNDKIYDIQRYKKDTLLLLTTTKIFLINLKKETIIKTLEL